MSETTIFVGVGGTGARILNDLAKLFSMDDYWRRASNKELYFLLIDTDAGDLKTYAGRKGSIQRYLPAAYVSYVHISENMNTLARVLADWGAQLDQEVPTEDGKNEALERFAEHWWFRDPENPGWEGNDVFTAHLVHDLKQGAGQVPPIGFLLAWKEMRKVIGAYKNLFTEMSNRRGGQRSDLPEVKYFGSLAGGTGRGALVPLAFTFKKTFGEHFSQNVPTVSLYTLDATCFENEIREPDQKLSTKINALTGFSELSAWAGIHREQEVGLVYRLPDPAFASTRRFDLINFDGTQMKGPAGEIPILEALKPFDLLSMNFREGPLLSLEDNEDHCAMMATGVYTQVSLSRLSSEAVNTSRWIMSVGASSASLDYHSIEEYFRMRARYDFLRNLQTPFDPAELEKQARSIAQKIFCRLFLGADAGDTDPVPALFECCNPDSDQNAETGKQGLLPYFLDKLMQEGGSGKDAVRALTKALGTQDLPRVMNTARNHFDPQNIAIASQAKFAQEFTDAVRDYAMAAETTLPYNSFQSWQSCWVRSLVGESGKKPEGDSVLESTHSVALLTKVAKCLLALFDDLGGYFTEDKLKERLGSRFPNVLLKIKEAQGREFPQIWKRFSEEEIDLIEREARRLFTLVSMQAFLKGVVGSDEGLFGDLREQLENIAANGERVVEAARHALNELPTKDLEEKRQKCFVIRNSEGQVDEVSLERAIPEFNAQMRFVKRIIKPIEPDTAADLVLDMNDDLFAFLQKELAMGPVDSSSTLVGALRPRLERQLEVNLAYRTRDRHGRLVPLSSLFEFGNVIIRLWSAWQVLFKRHQHNRDRFEELKDRFLSFFGGTAELNSKGEFQQITSAIESSSEDGSDGPILSLAHSLAANCRPFWKIKEKAEVEPEIKVLLPIDAPTDTAKDQWERDLTDLLNEKEVQVETRSADGNNPYLLSVYSAEGCHDFRSVTSLNYHTEGSLGEAMKLTEDRETPMVFRIGQTEHPGIYAGYRGSGFTEPLYLNDLKVRTRRWRPWIPEEEQEQDRKELAEKMQKEARESSRLETGERALAAIYALWGPLAFVDGVDEDLKENVRTSLETLSWPSGPILAPVSGRRGGKVQRIPGRLSESGKRFQEATDIGAISENDVLASSFQGLLDSYLTGTDASNRNVKGLWKAIVREYEEFMEVIPEKAGFSPAKSRTDFEKFIGQLDKRIGEMRKEMSNPEDYDLVNQARKMLASLENSVG